MNTTILKQRLEYGDQKIIAERADVAPATVSRVINNQKTTAAVVKKVVEAATILILERHNSLKKIERGVVKRLNKLS